MGWLAKLFGAASREELQGVSMGAGPAWVISRIRSAPEFFRALVNLAPEGSVLYLEGTPAADIIAHVESRPATRQIKLALGTIWPKPRLLHMAITRDSLEELARVAEHHAEPEICVHLHVYCGESVLLEWYDAFDDPLRLSNEIPEQQVKDFCQKLGCQYELQEQA